MHGQHPNFKYVHTSRWPWGTFLLHGNIQEKSARKDNMFSRKKIIGNSAEKAVLYWGLYTAVSFPNIFSLKTALKHCWGYKRRRMVAMVPSSTCNLNTYIMHILETEMWYKACQGEPQTGIIPCSTPIAVRANSGDSVRLSVLMYKRCLTPQQL